MIYHPQYINLLSDWQKWRDAYAGGQNFIDNYLEQLSSREDATDFDTRKAITYVPAFAKAAINDIKNAIFQRLVDISREGGSESYQGACKGFLSGVDLLGSSMNSFIGRIVLPELLVLGKVGIFVDNPSVSELNIDTGKHPYLYIYSAEDIVSWSYDEGSNSNEYKAVLLKDYRYGTDEKTGLPNGKVHEQYRYLYTNELGVVVEIQDVNGNTTEAYQLNIKKIPFICLELSSSLMADVANYQIAHLNLASSDMAYALKANFPFYTEQFSPQANSAYLQKKDADGNEVKSPEIKVGVTQGRAYPINTERPGFINPSPDPLRVSMEKQHVLKQEIRQLVNLAVTNLDSKLASAESKGFDERGLEAGLSYIGLELEHAERKIAELWALYEGSKQATVNYPGSYSLRTDDDRRTEAKDLISFLGKIPSLTYQKRLAKQIVKILEGSRVSNEELDLINSEIESAPTIVSDYEQIAKDVEMGLVSAELASRLRLYPKGEAEKAKQEHAERLARISAAQGGGNINDSKQNPAQDNKQEKAASRQTVSDDTVSDKTRGKE
jgi:hypothetical protein